MKTTLALLMGVTFAASACGASDGETAEATPQIVIDGATTEDSSDSASEVSAGSSDEELALEFAQCMRDEGVGFDDPTVNADGSIDLIQGPGAGGDGGINPNDPAVTEAFDKCGSIIEGASFLPGAGQDQSELEDTFLEFAQCLRDLGFDVDDPDLSGGFAGGGGPASIFGDGFDLTDPANADAVQECQGAFGAGGPFGGTN